MTEQTWGWAGSVREFLTTPREKFLTQLGEHIVRLLDKHPSSTQTGAWVDEHSILVESLQACVTVEASAPDWSIVFEYELPLEGGRRPDVVILAGGTVLVLEFKTSAAIRAGDLDQTRAYAQDLADYHKESHGLPVKPILVLTGAKRMPGPKKTARSLSAPTRLLDTSSAWQARAASTSRSGSPVPTSRCPH